MKAQFAEIAGFPNVIGAIDWSKMLFLASTSEISTSTSHSLKFLFSTFLHYLLSPNKRTTAGLFILISILNEGGVRAESRARACTLNFTLIGMYKENLREIVLTQGLIHPDLFVRSSFPDFARPQSFSKKSTQVFVHEAPGH